LGAFLLMKYQKNPLVIIVSIFGFAAILGAQRIFMITHTDSSGHMQMEMEMTDAENKMPDDMDM
jgi:hypothetical protein